MMNIEAIMSFVWEILNTPAGITVMASGLLYVLNRIYSTKPLWANFEGTIISAIKHAEKAIPDNVHNKGLVKLDKALEYVVKVYEETHRRRASKKLKENIKEGIQVIHNRLEDSGTLKK